LEIVENEGLPWFQTAEPFLKKTSGKNGDALEIFRGQQGQGFFPFGEGTAEGVSQIIKKSGRVIVGFLDLVPEAGDTPFLLIGTDQGGLAAAPRPGDPDDRSFLKPVQLFEQPLPENGLSENGSAVPARRGFSGRTNGRASPIYVSGNFSHFKFQK